MPKKEVEKKEVSPVRGTTGMLEAIWGFVAWLTGIIVSLAVGSGLISHTLSVPWIPVVVTETAGWIVVILTALGAILAIMDKFVR